MMISLANRGLIRETTPMELVDLRCYYLRPISGRFSFIKVDALNSSNVDPCRHVRLHMTNTSVLLKLTLSI